MTAVRRLGIVMDPIESINVAKDTSLALLLAAQQRNTSLFYLPPKDLFLRDGHAFAQASPLRVFDQAQSWFTLGDTETLALDSLDVILMRLDPPFNMNYIITTYLLEYAERAGTVVVNRPQSLRDANEKVFIGEFPDCCAPTLVSTASAILSDFISAQHDVILKPLDGMGGRDIFRVQPDDANTSAIIDTLTQQGERHIMAQRYLPEITAGDKRILLINGEPIPYALARIPSSDHGRGNLARGAQGRVVALSARDKWLCQRIGPSLREKGLLFVGLDVIGDYITEINVTSPTCLREIEAAKPELAIADQLMDVIAAKLGA